MPLPASLIYNESPRDHVLTLTQRKVAAFRLESCKFSLLGRLGLPGAEPTESGRLSMSDPAIDRERLFADLEDLARNQSPARRRMLPHRFDRCRSWRPRSPGAMDARAEFADRHRSDRKHIWYLRRQDRRQAHHDGFPHRYCAIWGPTGRGVWCDWRSRSCSLAQTKRHYSVATNDNRIVLERGRSAIPTGHDGFLGPCRRGSSLPLHFKAKIVRV